jgi:hypothetical protein
MVSSKELKKLLALNSPRLSGSRVRSFVSRPMYQQSEDISAGAGGLYNNAMPSEPQRSFSRFNIYKGKGALQLSFILPTWRELNTSNNKGGIIVEREGTLFLEFANVNLNAPQQVSCYCTHFSF